jgi:hypothetical protein
MSKWWCLYFYIALLVGVWVLLFVRALARQKLLKAAIPFLEHGDLRDEWAATYHGARRIFGETRRLRLIQRSLSTLPAELKKSHARFVFMSRAVVSLIALLVLLAFFAYRVCVGD